MKSHYLTPLDFTAIGYVFKNSTCPVEKLVLDNCKFGQDSVAAFLEVAGSKVQSLNTLCFHGKSCVMEQYKCLNLLLKSLTYLKCLDISNTDLGPKKIEHLTTNGVVLQNLNTLMLSDCKPSALRGLELLKFNSSSLQQVVAPITVDLESEYTSIDKDWVKAFGLNLFFVALTK